MPKVPIVSSPQVKASPLPGVRQRAQASPDAFGAGVGKALEQGANVVGSIALQELRDQNLTRAKELEVEFSKSQRELLYNPETGYFNRRGQDALQYQPVAEKAIDELIQQTLEKAETPAQRLLLQKTLAARAESAKLNIARHSTKEYEAWKDAAAKAAVDDTIEEAAVSYEDPEYLEGLRQRGRNEIMEMGERKGVDGEVTNKELEDYDSKFYSAIVENMMVQNPKRAEQFFEENKRYINGSDRTALLKKLKIAKYGDLATDWGDYAKLMDMAVNDREGFIKEDLNKYQLSATHMAEMVRLKRTVAGNQAKADEQVRGIGEAMSLAKASLAAAGIKVGANAPKKHRELVDKFQGALLREIEAYRKANDKRYPSEAEVKAMIDTLLIKGTYPDRRLFGVIRPDVDAYIFEGPNEEGDMPLVPWDEIPDDHKDAIKRLLQSKGKLSNETEIRKIYTQRLLMEKMNNAGE